MVLVLGMRLRCQVSCAQALDYVAECTENRSDGHPSDVAASSSILPLAMLLGPAANDRAEHAVERRVPGHLCCRAAPHLSLTLETMVQFRETCLLSGQGILHPISAKPGINILSSNPEVPSTGALAT